jgi:hypothetical protein
MTRLRLLALLGGAVAVLVLLAVRRPGRQPPSTFATPEDCVQAYAEACQEGDVAGYRRCLAEDLRAGSERQDAGKLAMLLRASMAGVKSWVQAGPSIEGDEAQVDVDVVRPEGTRRIRFHLARSSAGWLIKAVEAPRDVPTPIRFGTHVSAASD